MATTVPISEHNQAFEDYKVAWLQRQQFYAASIPKLTWGALASLGAGLIALGLEWLGPAIGIFAFSVFVVVRLAHHQVLADVMKEHYFLAELMTQQRSDRPQ